MPHKYKYLLELVHKFKLVLCFSTLFCVLSLSLFAQQDKKTIKKEKRLEKQRVRDEKRANSVDSNYIHLLPLDKILVGGQFGGIDNRFILRDRINKHYYRLASNIVPSFGAHFKYKRLPMISFSLPVTLFSKNSPFVTRGFSAAVHFQPARLLFLDAYYFQIKGLQFNGRNPTDSIQTYHNSKALNILFDLFFVFNHAKYSYKNAFLSGEKQKKSSGSVALGLSLNGFNQFNETPLFSRGLSEYNTLNYKQVWGFAFSSMVGYLHTFVIKKRWYIGGGLFYGVNFHFGKANYHSTQASRNYFNVSSAIKVKIAAGYSHKRVMVKLKGHSGFKGYKTQKKNAFNNYVSSFKLSFTYII